MVQDFVHPQEEGRTTFPYESPLKGDTPLFINGFINPEALMTSDQEDRVKT